MSTAALHDMDVSELVLFQLLFDVERNVGWFDIGSVSFDYLAVAIDEKLGEIPLDCFGAESAGRFFCKVLVQWMCFVANDFYLFEHREIDAVILGAESRYFLFAGRFLWAN